MTNLTQKLKYIVEDLQSQEALCVQKYQKNACQAKDPALKTLFTNIGEMEQKHYDSLTSLLEGNVPSVNANDTAAMGYNPASYYTGNFNLADKQNDQYLCTDTISTEKYVSSAYDFNLYQFGDPNVRKLLNDIQTEEQNHAEMLYKYKVANQMV